MNKIFLIFSLFIFSVGAAQNVKDKFEKSQPQDFSVPQPPKTLFPAQYAKGNKVFLEEVRNNLNQSIIKDLPKNSFTQIILKIDSDGNLVNISTYGKDEVFDNEVQNAVKAIANGKWIAGKNAKGEAVVDIVRLPFKYSN